MSDRETVAEAIYMTHWANGMPIWEHASRAVKEWVLKQADAAIAALDELVVQLIEPVAEGHFVNRLTGETIPA